MKKKLIILSGFLGSGKTTFLQILIDYFRTQKVAVLLNDFGKIPVDGTLLDLPDSAGGEVVELGGGSVFCACLKESFVKALYGLAATPAETVLIEASGMADPAGFSRLLDLSGLASHFEAPLNICLFDPEKSVKLAKVLEVIPRQVRAADLVLITKSDASSEESLEKAEACVRELNAHVSIVRHGKGQGVNIEDIEAMAKAPRQQQGFSFASSFNTEETRPDTFMITQAPKGIEVLCKALENFTDIVRVKGYLADGDKYLYLSDTASRITITETHSAPTPLVVICLQDTAQSVQDALVSKGLAVCKHGDA